MEKFFLYILPSEKNGKYYIGVTKKMTTRLAQHNRGMGKSTRSSRPWKLVYSVECNSLSEATKRKIYIKNQKSRAYIEVLIKVKIILDKMVAILRECPPPVAGLAPFF